MKELTFKTHKPGETNLSHHFYVLNKGKNCGKPSRINIWRNCFVVSCEDEDTLEKCFWVCFSLWLTNSFYPYRYGSVIETIRINDLKKCVTKAMTTGYATSQFVNALGRIEAAEADYNNKLSNLKSLKQALAKTFTAANRSKQ